MKKLNRFKFLNLAGFTLIEMLVVAALLPIIAIAAFSNFNAGYKLWKKINVENPEEDLNIFYRTISKDLNNAFVYASWPHEFLPESITLNTFMDAPTEIGGNRAIGRVKYYFDSRQHAIFRERKNVHEIYKETEGKKFLLLGHVKDFKLTFFILDKINKKYIWMDEWDSREVNLPIAIRFSFTLDTGVPYEETFHIPCGGNF